MCKRVFLLLIVFLLCVFGLFASGWHFVFGDLTQHPEILWGFLPSYLDVGVGYSGLSFIEGNKTDFQLLVGGGFNQRKLWQDPATGEWIYENPLVYDVIDFDWSFRLAQGFFPSPYGDKDLLTVTLAYNGQFERAINPLTVGTKRLNGTTRDVKSIDDFYSSYSGIDENIYPEINGNRNFLGTQIALYLRLDAMEDSIHENNGFLAKASLLWGPKALNSTLDGFADYYSAAIDMIGSYTLYDYVRGGNSWFSIVAIDRANFSYTGGSAIPAFIQAPASLGRKMRGFDTYTYNTDYSVVNNFDIRLAGPNLGVRGIAPRLNLFFDMGYGWGNINNTDIDESSFLSSTGVQCTVTFFDFIDLGYQIAYLISGDSFSKGQDKRVVGSFTFFLDF